MIRKKMLWIFGLFVAVVFQGCASSGAAINADGVRVYNAGFNKVANLVERSIRANNFSMDFVMNKEERIAIRLSRQVYIGTQRTSRDQGAVRIIKVADHKIRVEVDNPEYNYSVPRYKRVNYQRLIFEKLDSKLAGK